MFNDLEIQDQTFQSNDLRRSDFSHSTLTNCVFTDVNFTQTEFLGASFLDCEFTGCNFHRAFLTGVQFARCEFNECNFDEAYIFRSQFLDCDLVDCTFTQATLMSTIDFSGTGFVECTYNGTKIRRPPLIIDGLDFPIVALDNGFLQVGCHYATYELFYMASIREAAKLDGLKASRFWRKNKAWIFMCLEAQGLYKPENLNA
jgi:uncharacterized protein YjbI with pentapeptide repeats